VNYEELRLLSTSYHTYTYGDYIMIQYNLHIFFFYPTPAFPECVVYDYRWPDIPNVWIVPGTLNLSE
jgi:hypothetical protein